MRVGMTRRSFGWFIVVVFGFGGWVLVSGENDGEAHQQLHQATDLLKQARENVLKERENMAKEREKLKTNLKRAMGDLKAMSTENQRLREELEAMGSTLKQLQDKADNPELRAALEKAITDASTYIQEHPEFEKVDMLVNEIQARMDIVFGKEYSWVATFVAVCLAIFFPIFLSCWLTTKVVRSISLGAYCVMFEGVFLSFSGVFSFLSVFVGLDPFSRLRDMSETWSKACEIVIAAVALLLAIVLIRLTLARPSGFHKRVYVLQLIILTGLVYDYTNRVWIPIMFDHALENAGPPVLFAYFVVAICLLCLGIYSEIAVRNIKGDVVPLAGAVEPLRQEAGDEESALEKQV
eukprot:CAMPEP_0184677718 /NCGR_PEP_ID=MMETSP0312-20130426/300_1 /TAXON_ID=31354 /ORGANISM="Compsopogon coeruleus, Strain SAG 36.94" /LENGTH=350 /DNA_ID=CAMNT_0027125745 /DNA_START=1 /DNA_END=1053 /DNA_ORIENTATION=+